MANTKQARKRARQAEKRRQLNVSQRSELRSHIRKVVRALRAGDKSAAQAAYTAAVPVIDRMAGRNIIHSNAASRYKSRLNTRVKNLA
ncbi:MAG: 30S ribosomal protein S20 [Gammaproteobacteria bacterium]|nr:30S ribosomal protein S20 [Gammaproteobacteria bacterium]